MISICLLMQLKSTTAKFAPTT